MALTERENSEGYVIDSYDSAREAMEMAHELELGMKEDLKQISELKEGVVRWMVKNDQKQIAVEGGHATLVQRTGSGRWDREKLLKAVKKAYPTGRGWKNAWNAMTTPRQPDGMKIQQAVRDGLISEKAIEKAFTPGSDQKPFVQVYADE
jgi:hypothetical protein